MAFIPVSLPIQEILETTYVSDMRLYINTNTGLLKDKVETLINNLKVDLDGNKIGVDSDSTQVPINEIKTKTLTIQNGNLFFKNATGTGDPLIKFEIATDNTQTIGKITTGSLIANNTITAAALAITGASTFTGSVTAAGRITTNNLSISQGFANSSEVVNCVLVADQDGTRARAELSLTANSRSMIILDLDASNFMDGSSLDDTTIADGIDIVLMNDGTLPITAGQTFTIMVRKVYYLNSGTPTTIDWYTYADANDSMIRIIAEDFAVNNQDDIGSSYSTLTEKWLVGLSNRVFNSSVTFMNIGQVKNNANLPDTWAANTSKLVIAGNANAVFNTTTYPA